ncbi:hypothetical protein LK08_31535 [Streptomyces sp. MUSC 125]|nr:hypothetical protein LK08_31535 [Streptomyces sp. MUSC 125]
MGRARRHAQDVHRSCTPPRSSPRLAPRPSRARGSGAAARGRDRTAPGTDGRRRGRDGRRPLRTRRASR